MKKPRDKRDFELEMEINDMDMEESGSQMEDEMNLKKKRIVTKLLMATLGKKD